MAERQLLLISPDNAFNESSAFHLNNFGFSVTGVVDYEEGLHKAESRDFQIVILRFAGDIEKRVSDVLKFVQVQAPVEFVILTDAGNKEKAMEVFGERAWRYLVDPFSLNELAATCNRIYSYTHLCREVTDKSQQVAYLEVINNITREALLCEDSEKLLWFIVREIRDKLGYSNVNIFDIDDTLEHAVLKAYAGVVSNDLYAGYTLKMGEGMVGWTALKRQSLLSGDVKHFPQRIQGFVFEENIQSELAVPIMFENRILGVLHVESTERDAFSKDDVIVLETLADQISLTFVKMRLSRELRESYDLRSIVNDILPVSIIILTSDLTVEYVNRTFCESVSRQSYELLQEPLDKIFPDDILHSFDMIQDLRSVLEHGYSLRRTNIHHSSPLHHDRVLNFTFVRVRGGESPLVMILMQDITENTQKTYQLSLLREISIAMQGVLERDKLLHLILTCVTAGFAIGFNRAFILLVNESTQELKGYMGVGPRSHEDAYRIWNELSGSNFTFQQYLDTIQNGHIERSGLQDLIENISFDMGTTDNVLVETVRTGHYMHVVNAWQNPKVDETMKRFVAGEFVCIPLIARNRGIGVLLADNAYSGRSITPESIEILTMFGSQAGLAIENARILMDLEEKVNELQYAYLELEKTHDMLVRHEKLAAIGEVSARIAHEIRNPLATIGGFAKTIQKKYDDRERTIRNANIIVAEVERLEGILTNVLDFSKPSTPKKIRVDVNTLVKESLVFIENHVVSNNIFVALDLADRELEAELDAAQIRQVLINVLKNAVNAMSDGGVLGIRTGGSESEVFIEVNDTGKGIPQQYLNNIFEPFFTTHGNGTGLGLSISHRIIQNHQGRLDISSREGEGTTVRIMLPVSTEGEHHL